MAQRGPTPVGHADCRSHSADHAARHTRVSHRCGTHTAPHRADATGARVAPACFVHLRAQGAARSSSYCGSDCAIEPQTGRLTTEPISETPWASTRDTDRLRLASRDHDARLRQIVDQGNAPTSRSIPSIRAASWRSTMTSSPPRVSDRTRCWSRGRTSASPSAAPRFT